MIFLGSIIVFYFNVIDFLVILVNFGSIIVNDVNIGNVNVNKMIVGVLEVDCILFLMIVYIISLNGCSVGGSF